MLKMCLINIQVATHTSVPLSTEMSRTTQLAIHNPWIITITAFLGSCKYKVTVDGIPVPDSPFPVKVESGCDPSMVKVYGPGIEFGKLNSENKFTIETKGAGTGALGLSVEGPTEAKMTCTDNRYLFA